MFKQAKNIFLLAVIVFSTIAVSLSFPNTASADTIPSTYLDPQLTNNAIASAYRTALALCLTLDGGTYVGGNGDGTVSAQDVANNKWFSGGDLRVGYLVNQSDGGSSCNTLFQGRDIEGTFGFSSNIQFACALGLTRDNKSDCVNGNGDFDDNLDSSGQDKGRDHVYAALDAQRSNAIGQTGPVPGSVNFNPLHGYTNEQYYVMAANTYLVACSATPVTTTPTIDQQNSGLAAVNVVDYQGNATTVYFSQGNNDKKKFRNFENNFNYMDENCDTMRTYMKTYGPAYQAWVKSHQPGMNGTPGTCDERYPPSSDAANNKACIDGFSNKSTANYCANTYATTDQFLQDERAACIYGITAIGGTGTTPPPSPVGGGVASSKPTCAINGVGWIICPVMNNFLAPAVDASYGFVSALLTIQPLMSTGGTSTGSSDTYTTLYNAWSIMRNFANIGFVGVFLFIIFSQVTGIGIKNRALKIAFPRAVLSIVVVNASFWLCSIPLDLSNIAGTSMGGIFNGITNTLANTSPSGTPSVFSTGSGWVGITGTALAGVGISSLALYATLAALLPMLILVLTTIVTVAMALGVRQVLFILLVASSPIPAVIYVLDDSLAKKWLKLFRELLEMFPFIAFIFGASKLASQIIMNTTSTNKAYTTAFQVMGAGTEVLPLLFTLTFMKGVNGLVGKIINNGGRGATAKLNKSMEDYQDRRKNIAKTRRLNRSLKTLGSNTPGLGGPNSRRRRTAAWLSGAGASTAVNTAQKNQNAKNALSTTQQNYVVTRAGGNAGGGPNAGPNAYAQAIATPVGNAAKIQAAAAAAQKKEIEEAIKNAEISADIKPGSEGIKEIGQALERALVANDTISARAMQNLLMTSGGAGLDQYRKTMTKVEGNTVESGSQKGTDVMQSTTALDLQRNMLANHGGVKASAADLIRQASKGGNMSAITGSADTWHMSDAELVKQKPESLTAAIASGGISHEQAQTIINRPELAKDVDRTILAEMERI